MFFYNLWFVFITLKFSEYHFILANDLSCSGNHYKSLFLMNANIHNQGRIFQNHFLEKLTKSNPKVTIVFYSFLIVFFFCLNYLLNTISIEHTIGFYLLGLASWTLMEYMLHRFVFHIDEYFPFMKRFHYMIHGIHHEYPRDVERLFMPPIPGTIISFFLFLFWYLVFGWSAFAFMAGIINGYLLYSYIHYKIHTNPSTRFFHRLWVHHAKHHYKFPDKAYGVSSPFWDIIFGTMPPKRKNG